MSARARMRCHDAAPYLSALLDSELTEPTRGVVATHVAGCTACRHRLDRLARIDRLVASLPESAPAPDLLDRVLATAQQRHPGPVLRESMRHRNRRRAVRVPTVFSLPDDLGVPRAQPAVHRPRPLWVTAALPTLAALLILSMTLVVFHRLPSHASTTSSARTLATPVALGTAIEQTHRAVEQYAAQLPFTPALPTYLPPNAQPPAVTVGPANVGFGSRVLDVVWKWSCATCTVSEVHLREAPLPLEARNDWAIAPAEPGLSWQIPGANAWRPGTLQDRVDLGRWAVGQDRTNYSITLDVASTAPTATDQPSDVETNALRLISLSMDVPYAALTVTPPNFASTAVRFTARSFEKRVTWDALVAPNGLEKVTVIGGSSQYSDVSNGTTVLRLDTAAHVYATLPVAAAADPTFSAETQQFFLDANTALSYGQLWPLTGTVMFDGVPAEPLFLVGAPHPTYIYVQTSTLRVLGASVDYGSPVQPGGPDATSKLTPSSGCPAYVQISFQPWNGVTGSDFSMTPPPDYSPGDVPRSLTC